MLRLTIPATEYYNEATNEFTTIGEQVLEMEHSLLSLSKWESKWHKPFLGQDEKTQEELLDYFRCMTITKNVSPIVYYALTPDNVRALTNYMNDSMTATHFSESSNKKFSREIITAEIIYYWMIEFGIPLMCEKWHLNRLLTLVRVCSEKNAPAKKMSKNELFARNRMLNTKRRAQLHSRG